MKKKKKKRGSKNKFKKIIVIFNLAYALYNNGILDYFKQYEEIIPQVNEIVEKEQIVVKTEINAELEQEQNTKEIPVCNSSSTKTYMDYKKITNKESTQWKYIHTSGKITIENGYLKEGEYIGVALGSYFGKIGTKYIFTLDTGNQIKVVKVEEKADEHTNNGCEQKWDNSVIEFVIDSSQFNKAQNGYVYSGNFNNNEEFKGNIEKIEMIIE